MEKLVCFKAYDIRGQLGTELNEDVAYRIGRAYAQFLNPTSVVVGGDMRLSTESLKLALSNGLRDSGVDVLDIGLCGTEEIYFATAHLKVDGGIVVTASHNPEDYNGMKMVRKDSKPISADTGLTEIESLTRLNQFDSPVASNRGAYNLISTNPDYVQHLLSYIQPTNLRPMKLVVNAGNGVAGHVVDAIEQAFLKDGVPVQFIKVHHEPDGTFPNGIPNPLLQENRQVTTDAVLQHGADMGIAWDGDFDRCFLFDEKGRFIEGYYIVGLLAEAFLQKSNLDNPTDRMSTKIIHDPRLTWNTLDVVKNNAGEAVQCKSGHAFIKECMRQENAVYGGEMSAHHYFKDFFYCDSGMIPWLLVSELISSKGLPLSALVSSRVQAYPCSGEINYAVDDVPVVLERVMTFYQQQAPAVDKADGVSLEFTDWRMNIRASNTEPLLRLNIESRGNAELVASKLTELEGLICGK